MRQVRLVLLLLMFIASPAFSNEENGDIDYSLPIYNSALQEDSVIENEKEDNSPNNKLSEYGPITVCSDKAVYNNETGTLVYTGKVFVMQIHNKHILCHKPQSSYYKWGEIFSYKWFQKKWLDSPNMCHKPQSLEKGVTYFIRDKDLSFKELQKSWLSHAKELCLDEKECHFISGQTLTIQLDKKKNVTSLTMSSQGQEKSQFYNYPIDINSNYEKLKTVTNGPVVGEGEQIVYNVPTQSIELQGKAIAVQKGNEYKGDKVIYDVKHDLISIPGNKDKRSTMVLDGVEKQTKIDTGLTPISQYQKDEHKGSVIGLNTYNTDSHA